MNEETMDENFWVPEAMIRAGGGFVKALGHLFRKADLENQNILKTAFDFYWDDYREIALENWERWQAED